MMRFVKFPGTLIICTDCRRRRHFGPGLEIPPGRCRYHDLLARTLLGHTNKWEIIELAFREYPVMAPMCVFLAGHFIWSKRHLWSFLWP